VFWFCATGTFGTLLNKPTVHTTLNRLYWFHVLTRCSSEIYFNIIFPLVRNSTKWWFNTECFVRSCVLRDSHNFHFLPPLIIPVLLGEQYCTNWDTSYYVIFSLLFYFVQWGYLAAVPAARPFSYARSLRRLPRFLLLRHSLQMSSYCLFSSVLSRYYRNVVLGIVRSLRYIWYTRHFGSWLSLHFNMIGCRDTEPICIIIIITSGNNRNRTRDLQNTRLVR
jgi:hypothetical protein